MPERKIGVIEKLKYVFRGKKNDCGDIVCQAEKVISDYIVRRRNEIINKYSKHRSWALDVVAFGVSVLIIYAVYKIVV